MTTKMQYTDEPIGKIEIVPDFLPSPEKLVFRDEDEKVTLVLSKKSVDFFKAEASKHHAQYQHMIRRFLDSYIEAHEEALRDSSKR